ncbi:MAG: cupin domain-containing protein [Polyangiaceae bacterium]|jgi:quercetin dioxygenase-like cupin family protein
MEVEIEMTRDLEAWSVLSLALQPVAPPLDLRGRLMASIERSARFRPFSRDIARWFDLTERAARDLLARVDDPAAWEPGVGRILGFMHFEPGPRLAPAHCGLVRMKDGARVPLHRHVEREVTLVLEGGVVDGDGTRYGPGQALEMPPGSAHTLRVVGNPEALLAVLQADIDVIAG